MPSAKSPKPGFGRCPVAVAEVKLARRNSTASQVDPGRFQALHSDGRKLIRRWIGQADQRKSGEPFEAFIYAWIGFNGWAACVCVEEHDKVQLQMMELDGRLTRNFVDLMGDSEFREAAQGFSSLWPIFRVSDLPEAVRRTRQEKRGRAAVTNYYQSKCPDAARSPDCHLNHTPGIDPDWAHTLEALYRVRCNLFHGQKSGGGNEDRAILQAAVRVLLPVAASVLKLR